MPSVLFEDYATSLELPAGRPLMEACDRLVGAVPFLCRIGTCRTCMIRIEEGMDNLSPRSQREEILLLNMPGIRLACQAIVHGDISLTRRNLNKID